MPIEVKCPVCGKVNRFSEDRAGRRNVCKSCGVDVDVDLPRSGKRSTGAAGSRKTSRKGSRKTKSEGPSAALIGGVVFGVVVVAALVFKLFLPGGSAPPDGSPAVAGSQQPPGTSGPIPAAAGPMAPPIAYKVSNWTAQADPPRATQRRSQ